MINDAQRLAQAETFIQTLLITNSRVKAAKAAGISTKTAREIEEQDWFRELMTIRRDQYSSVGVEQVGALFAQAIEVLTEAMHEEQPINLRLKAAEKVLTFSKRASASDVVPTVKPLPVDVTPAEASAELQRRRAFPVLDVTPAEEAPPSPAPDTDEDWDI